MIIILNIVSWSNVFFLKKKLKKINDKKFNKGKNNINKYIIKEKAFV